MKKLKVHPEQKYLMWEDGEPFFYLGETAWEIFHVLNKNEVEYFLTTRARQGFNVIQATALAGRDGLVVPNAYDRVPLQKTGDQYDPTKPDENEGYNYWQHVDYTIETAAKLGLFIGFLPTWGDKFNKGWGPGPEVFTPENAYIYGKWIGKRYSKHWNIIWILGGDRPLQTPEHKAIIDAMAKGIREEDGDKHLMTFHPSGMGLSTNYVKGEDYIDFHTVQSGHRTAGYDSWKLVKQSAQAENKPYLDSEPRYEDFPASFRADGYLWNADDIRQNLYWNLMEGVCGHTYGNNSTWAMEKGKGGFYHYYWQDVMNHDGAEQMKHVLTLRLSRPYFEFRPAPELVMDDTAVMAHQAAGRGEHYAFIYSPLGLPIRAYLDKLTDKDVKAAWFNPRTGETSEIFAILPPKEVLLVPPTSGKGCDWVAILDVLIKKDIKFEE